MATHEPIAPAESWSEPGKYEAAWEPLRRAERNQQDRYQISFAVTASAVLLGFLSDHFDLPGFIRGIAMVLVLVGMAIGVAAVVSSNQIWRFRCPRCGTRFYNYWTKAPRKTCRNCNLFIYQARD